MLNRTPVFNALGAEIIGSGLLPDKHTLQVPLWEAAESVTFRHGQVVRRQPNTVIFSAGAEPIRGIGQQQDSDGVRWIWAASGGDVFRWYGPPKEAIIAGATWTEDEGVLYQASYWDILPYGNWTILNNGHGQPQVHRPGIGTATLGDVPSDVVTMLKKQAFILALGYGAAKTRVGWSNGDIIDEWTAAPDSLAGALSIEDFNTPLRAAKPLGSRIAMFAEDQMAILSYRGSPYYFGYEMAFDGFGAVSKVSVAGDGKQILGVGRNGIWWTDGLSYKYIDTGYLHDYLQEVVNWSQASKIFAARDDVTGCFDFCFPVNGSLVPNETWTVDPNTGAWSKTPAFSYKDERRLFRTPLIGTLAGDVEYDQDAAETNTLVLRTKPLLGQLQHESGLLDVHNNVHVQEIDLLLKKASNVAWRIGSCQAANGTYTWTGWIAAEAGAKTHLAPVGLPAGVYHKLEFTNTAASWDLDLQGFMLFGKVEGTKRSALA